MMKNKTLLYIIFLVIISLILTTSQLLVSQEVEIPETYKKDISYGVIVEEEDKGKVESRFMYTILVDPMDRAEEWSVQMPNDQGYAKAKAFKGAPEGVFKMYEKQAKVTIWTPPRYRNESGRYSYQYFQERFGAGDATSSFKYLGVKIDFMQRGYSWFKMEPPAPIYIEGQTHSFEVWVAGRNKNHKLFITIKDFYGQERHIEVGSLNFMGWKKLTVHVPTNIVQFDYKVSDKRGITFTGFLVQCNPDETYGSYYIYLDHLSARISRFYEENKDTNDPIDTW